MDMPSGVLTGDDVAMVAMSSDRSSLFSDGVAV